MELKLVSLLMTSSIDINTTQAIIKRQKPIEKASTLSKNLMKIAAVPKRTPAVAPSIRASLLVLACIQIPVSVVSDNVALMLDIVCALRRTNPAAREEELEDCVFHLSTDTLLSPASFSTRIKWSASSAKASL